MVGRPFDDEDASAAHADVVWSEYWICLEFWQVLCPITGAAGHSTVRMTEGYTKIQLNRQEELTRRIQERLASVGEEQSASVVKEPNLLWVFR